MNKLFIFLTALAINVTHAASYQNVAVLIFPQNETAKSTVKAAQARIESIMMDNGVTVLDQDVAEKMKLTWRQLEDPEYFVTAEDFVSKTSVHDLDAVLRVYLSVDKIPTFAGYFSATAQADIRVIDRDEQVKASSQLAMGSLGIPPSDGLTLQSALHNATLRASDTAMESLAFEVASLTTPNAIDFSLVETSLPADTINWFRSDGSEYTKLAELSKISVVNESVTCATTDNAKSLAAIAGYIADTTLANRMSAPTMPSSGMRAGGMQRPSMGGGNFQQSRREYGSRLHIIDIESKKEIKTFTTREVGPPIADEDGGSQVFACGYINSWRYLTAVTGNYLFLWDVERAVEFAKVRLPFVADEAQLGVVQNATGSFIVVQKGNRSVTYKVQRNK